MGVVKMLTFNKLGPFEINAQYADPAALLPGTSTDIGTWRIDVPSSYKVQKVKVKAELTIHGTFRIADAQLVEDEEYQETVEVKRELPQVVPSDNVEAPKD